MDTEKKDAVLDQARYDLAFSIRKLGTATQHKVEDFQAAVQPVKDAVNMKEHFKNHFWKTGLVCVGFGLFIARKKTAPVRLSQQQVNYILSELQKTMKSNVKGLNVDEKKGGGLSKIGHLISTSDLILPVGLAIAKGLYEKFAQSRETKSEDDVHPIAINHHIPSTIRSKSTH